jgi:hypothetical protein
MITDNELPDYPYDIEELKHIDTLLGKIPKYRERIAVLHQEIDELVRHVNGVSSFPFGQDIDCLIFKAFYIDLENRPFNTEDSRLLARLKAEIAWDGTVRRRNIPCEICGENRSVDKCHIVPRKYGGLCADENLLYLCPTHHRLFDRFMLSKKEWAIIDWERKSEPSQEYAFRVVYKAHNKFWRQIDDGVNDRIPLYEMTEDAFIEYVVHEIGNLFTPGRMIKRSSIYKMLDENIREVSKKVLAGLIKHNAIVQIGDQGSNMLILPSPRFEVSRDVISEIRGSIV